MSRLAGKTALVTGAGRGIGAAIAARLSSEGAKVVATDIDLHGAEATAASLGPHAIGIAHDVRDEAQWEGAVAAAIRQFGGLDILVNNAGVEIAGLVADFDLEECRRLFEINVFGVMLGLKHGLRAMRPGGAGGKGGAIVNLASGAAIMASPGLSAYAASKAAVDRLTRCSAVEAGRLGYGVRVNCLYPGMIQTDMADKLAHDFTRLGFFADHETMRENATAQIPAGRYGEVGDVAAAAAFLCSDEAAYITGAGLSIDGGLAIA